MVDTMVNQFEQVPRTLIDRSKFNRSSRYTTAIYADYLYPVFFDEVLPGDTKELNTTFFGRMTTPYVPVMDNIYLDYHLFYVPNRLIWDNFQKFMGERKNPTDSIDYLEPQVEAGESGFGLESLFDYLSIPPSVGGLSISAKWSRAYNLIWNEWYRDENLQNSVTVDLDDGPDSASDYVLLKRGKRFDYFTSCLPSPQKGPGASLPLGSTAPVVGNGYALGLYRSESIPYGVMYDSGPNTYPNTQGFMSEIFWSKDHLPDPAVPAGRSYANFIDANGFNSKSESALGVSTDPAYSGLIADLTSATAATINSLRQAIALQQFLERDMRSGTRYNELVFGHFGVIVPDARLQRPEYLGGSTTRLNISPVAQTSSSDNTSPQGNLAGYVTVGSTGNGFTRSFVEHGIILGLVSIRADLTYQQGIDRMFSRHTRYDYFWPTLAHLGEQAVLNKEIYAQGTDDDDGIFGYQERNAEYRFKNSYVTGKMRSGVSGSLDIWHLGQYFANAPTLSSQFIESNTDIRRILAVPGTVEAPEPQFYLDCWHDLTDIRPIPVYGTPGLTRI